MIWVSFESRNFINKLMSSKKGNKKMLSTANRSKNLGNSSTNLVISNWSYHVRTRYRSKQAYKEKKELNN